MIKFITFNFEKNTLIKVIELTRTNFVMTFTCGLDLIPTHVYMYNKLFSINPQCKQIWQLKLKNPIQAIALGQLSTKKAWLNSLIQLTLISFSKQFFLSNSIMIEHINYSIKIPQFSGKGNR